MSVSTKRALAQSLKTMMKSKSVDQITVTELVESCGMTRQTFYYHFQDIYALLEWVYEDDFLNPIKTDVDYTTWKESFKVILDYVYDNYAFCLNTLNSLQRNQFTRLFYTTIYGLLSRVFYEIPQAQAIEAEDAEFIINFYCHAFSGIVVDWIFSGVKQPSEAIIERLSWLMDQQYTQAIEKAMLHQRQH